MDNSTAPLDNYTVDYGDDTGFIIYNLVMLIVFLLPAVVVDVFLLIALLLDKSTPVQIRTVIVNLLLGALCVAFSLSLNHLTSIVLSTTDAPVPPNGFCHFMVWTMAGAGAVRMIFTAVFSIVVYILIKEGNRAGKKVFLVVCCVVLWIVAFALSAPLLAPAVVGSQFLGNAACFPKNTEESIGTQVTAAYVAFWAFVFGLVPLAVSFIVPIMAAAYLHNRRVGSNVEFQKAMVKFSLFLIVVILINFVGQVLPPILAFILVRLTDQSPLVYYLGLSLMTLSLLPTPVLILVFLRGTRQKAKEMCLCYCLRFRDDMSRADHASRMHSIYNRRGTESSINYKP